MAERAVGARAREDVPMADLVSSLRLSAALRWGTMALLLTGILGIFGRSSLAVGFRLDRAGDLVEPAVAWWALLLFALLVSAVVAVLRAPAEIERRDGDAVARRTAAWTALAVGVLSACAGVWLLWMLVERGAGS